MISKNTGSVAYALYSLRVEPNECSVRQYIDFYNKDNFLWYQFDDRRVEELVGYFDKVVKEEAVVMVDLVSYNHLFSCLKKMCRSERGNR
ncbi:hypothetical protein PBV87_11570 [Niameybacter massiliensis]|uniref:Uncharacterized protein n=1 Tax=Holtiella tumoricola TaxID=3018743 RepID=A0AA42J140_9FIRM|nr:hypothetical protein [Holtiella tumoricola]MDA3732122.1 hypothetical protein [Holtiella tumoricola]